MQNIIKEICLNRWENNMMLHTYIDKFNQNDIEYYKQDIDNNHAEEWLKENIPYFECPDKELEETYYFRWWVARKHVKTTEDGYVVTEFLPKVGWSGKHNTIVAAACHHIAEFRWLKNGKKILSDYIKFWLDEKGNSYDYSSWLIDSIYKFCKFENDFSIAIENFDLLFNFYEKTKKEHITKSGLFWSIDGRDAMEFSISGTTVDYKVQKGIRPTLNSYMYANAYALSEIAKTAGKEDISNKYREEAERIKKLIIEILWDGEFFKAIHRDDIENLESVSAKESIKETQNVKELIGFIPWWFNIPPESFSFAFEYLKDEKCFNHKYGFTTADQQHPRFLYEANHECLWNGYIWPFASSQTFNAIISFMDNYNQSIITKEDLYSMFMKYVRSHYRILENGEKINWLDEVKSPLTDEWSSRTLLEKWGWPAGKGGKERGKDYNHSTFCDILFRGILGIKAENGEISVNPRILDDWNYFKVENLWICNKNYTIIYDKDGTHYDKGKGVLIFKE